MTGREKVILKSVIESFIATGHPIGSRMLSKQLDLGLSPASIRNTLSDLEEQGYLGHPYTSAGRVPTDQGYRVYVDRFVTKFEISSSDRKLLVREIENAVTDADKLLGESSQLLSNLTTLLGIVIAPRFSDGVFHRLEVVILSSEKVMFVVTIQGGLVKTIIMEMEMSLQRDQVESVVSILNERLSGLKLSEIRSTFSDRLSDLPSDETGLVQVMSRNVQELFDETEKNRIKVGTARHIVIQQEFQAPEAIRNMMELVDNKTALVGLMEDASQEATASDKPVTVTIGTENDNEDAQTYSVVTATYEMGEACGTLGVIGPTRMDYARVMGFVEGMAAVLSDRAPRFS